MVSPKLRAKILKDAETARRLEQDAREKVLANAVASRMAQQDEKTKAFKQSSKDAAGFLSDMLLPQDLSEAALMAALAPARWIKKGAGPLVKMANETSSMRDLVTKRAKAVDATRAGLIGLSGATYTVESDASPVGVARRFKKYFDNPDELPGRLQGTNIIKEGGGNWTRVGREIEPLLVHVRTPGLNLHTAEHTARDVAQNEWLKKKLDSYIRNQMGTIDDPIRKMADEFPTNQGEKIAIIQKRLDKAISDRDRVLAENPNMNAEILTRSNARINDIEKELNLELGRKALHYEPEPLGGWESGRLALQRTDAGQLASGVAKEADARKWEDVSDYLIGAPRRRGGFPETYLEEYPWMAKLSPDDKIHELGYQDLYGTDDLGFQHLSDELRNLMDPESGLPANMLINPSELGKMSMADVVNRVAGVNAWREFQRSEDNLAKASNRATRLYKEYADNNPLGLRWVELRARQATPESLGYQIVESPNGVRILDSKGQSIGIADSVEAAQRKLRHHTPSELRDELADALKYEGDSLIHCVGGYCPDVISGRSRIFSLRDARGRPHTTIEVKPGQSPEGLIRGEDLPPEVSADLMKRNVYDPSFMWRKDELGRYTPEIGPFGNRITQIKGKRNRKPDDEYLPFIHDFVQTGDWSDVKDLHHTGLRKLTDAFNSNELAKIQEAGIEVPKYATQKEINDIGRKIWPDTWGNAYDDIPEFSRGGVARRFKMYFDVEAEPKGSRSTNIIKEKGGNWLGGGFERDMAALKRTAFTRAEFDAGRNFDMPPMTNEEWASVAPYQESNRALNSWIDKTLARYMKNEMATPEDPVRKLAERGVLHYDPSMRGWESRIPTHQSGDELKKLGQSELAQGWENLSDRFIYPQLAGNTNPMLVRNNPWLEAVKLKAPDTPVYSRSIGASVDNLGLQHLLDELRNAIDPASDLPPNLRLSADKLGKVTMPQAVQRVYDINVWRAEQAKLAQMAKTKALMLQKPFKEYKSGWRWTELPDPETSPENLDLVTDIGCQGGWCTQGKSTAKAYGGHSTGNRLYALIDPEGRSHVQIQTKPGSQVRSSLELEDPIADERQHYYEQLEKYIEERGVRNAFSLSEREAMGGGRVPEQYRAGFDEWYNKEFASPPDMLRRISEIKPFSNSWDSQMVKDFTLKNPKYKEEILPYLQDFVRKGEWSDVKDLENTGLRNWFDALYGEDLGVFRRSGVELPRYLTDDEVKAIREGKPWLGIPEFSRGGSAKRMFKKYFDTDAKPKELQGTRVVKEKGGNWLGGSVEDALRYLKRREYDAERALFRALPAEERLRRINLNRPTDNPIDMERINSWGDLYGHFGLEDAGPYALTLQERKSSPDLALNSWIDNTLTRYMKNEMATPEDPVRKLADRGVLHYNPYDLYSDRHLEHRSISGMLEPLAKTELGKQWEIISDSAISPDLAVNWRREASGATQAKIPGINKIPDTDMIHEILSGWAPARLGFPHLIDELGNAINPASDLPPNLRLSADKLGKVTVPQAVQRVHDINLYREEQARLADLAATKGLMLQKPFKEYKSGWRWAELPDPEASPENLNLVTKIGCQGGWCTQGEVAAHNYGGHAAGNRLYALIDPEGRVHTQIQTQFPKDEYPVSGEAFARLPQEIKDHYRAITAEWRKRNPDDPEVWKALAEAGVKPIPPSILQIKPFSNSWNSQMVKDFTLKNPKYKEEVIPYLQDFVRSGKWSDVSDLENAGLRNWFDAFSHSDLNELHRIGAKIPKYLTDDEIKVLLEGKSFPDIPEFSRGGVARRFKMYFDAEAEPKGSRSTNIIKEKGGNWVSGSVETGLKRYHQPVGAVEVNPTRQNVTAQSALSSWIDKTLARYVKNEMATSGDPVRELAERGVLHYTPDASHLDPQWSSYERAVRARRAGGFPEEGVAQSEQAKAWEMLSDLFIRRKAPWGGDVIPHHKLLDTFGTPAEKAAAKSYFGTITYDDASFNRFFNSNPGLKKRLEDRRAAKLLPAQKEYLAANKWATPDTVFYETPTFDHFDIGLRHLTDELRNAIDPASDLPPNLRLSADKLSKVTVPQAVQRVHDINLYRAEQARLANLAATQALMVQKPFKEYKSGWRWAELPDPEASPENLDLVKNIGCQGGWCTQGESAARNYGAHAAGKRLYALIDPEGRVHTQIQTVRNRSYGSDHLKAQRPQAEREAVEQGLDPDKSAYQSFVADRMYELAKENLPTSILQIKPFSNSWDSQMVKDFTLKNPKYKEEVIPYLQDFVRSGNWSDVQDLENAGLYPRSVLTLKEQALVPGKYVTMDEIKALREGKPWTPIDTTPEFAEGGLVRYNPAEIDVMVDELRTMVYG